jgi:Protein of unknown function (DUF4038)/Putative collagen-binding domain of a collagenase
METLTKFRITYTAFCLVLLCAMAILAHAATMTVTNANDSGAGSLRQSLADNAGDTITLTPTPTPSFPLKVSANGHYLTTQDGTPFLVVGDTVWLLPTQGNNQDIDDFLANRAAKGFNAVLVQLIDTYFSDNSPNNIDGVPPFTTFGDFSTYNPAYFNRVDYLIDQAANYGIVVFAAPHYLAQCNNHGWAPQVAADTTAHFQAYATFLGNRYKNKGNIVWVMGGDTDPFACGVSAKVDAFATALLAADPNHLITEHNGRGMEGIVPWLAGGVPSWFTLNSTYTDNLTFSQSQSAWNRTPAKPFVMLEAYYLNEHGVSRTTLRNQAYWTYLSGNVGYMLGACPMWRLNSSVATINCPEVNADWRPQMESNAAFDVVRLKAFLSPLQWEKLVPDFNHSVVTAGFGTGTTTVTTSRASDGSFAMSYLPQVSGITVNMAQLSGPSVQARWYDPTNGTYSTIAGSPFPNTGTRVFTPPGDNNAGATDWVLLLDTGTLSTPKATPSLTCALLQKRLDRLQRRQRRLKQLDRSNKKLNQRVRRLRRQVRLQACL